MSATSTDERLAAQEQPPVQAPLRRRRVQLDLVLLLTVLSAVVAHRLYLVVSTDFPINDGGLFVPYIEGSRDSFPLLPESIGYNGLELPYAYPPLGFWLGGLLGTFGIGAVTVLHVVPALLNALWIVLLAVLFLREGHSRLFAAAAVTVLAVAFRSYEWLVMGGGLTRGLGAVFLVLSLLALGRTRGREPVPLPLRAAVLAGACVAGAILAHLEWGLLAAAAVVVQRTLCSTSVKGFLVTTFVAGASALLLLLPWLALVLSRHGVEPFLAASGTSAWYPAGTLPRLEEYAVDQWPNLLMVVGAVVLLVRRHLFWPVFMVLCVLLTPRHSLTPLVVPAAYLTASGLEAVVRAAKRAGRQWRDLPEVAAVLALGSIAVVLTVVGVDSTRPVNPIFQPLSQDVREGMAWVRAEHPDEAFAVVTEPPWFYDATAEWFPELTGTTSSTTVQGTEWLPDDAFRRREAAVMAMKAAPTCEELVGRTLEIQPVRFVWTQTRPQCFAEAGMTRVYDNSEVTVFAVP